MISRRAFFDWIVGGLCVAVFGRAHAQDRSQGSALQKPVTARISPYQAIENAASAMKPGDAGSVREVVDAIVAFPRIYRMPDVMAAIVKRRMIDAQIAYLDGKTPGTVDAAVVDAINALATTFDAPDYERVSLLQVQYMRDKLASGMPMLFKPVTPDLKVGEPNVPMSPLQTMFVMSILIDQKFSNGDYQKSPEEWDRDMYPRLVKKDQAMAQEVAELRRRIAAGEDVPKAQLRIGDNEPATLTFFFSLQRQIAAMSVTDGLKLFNETFARLGIQ